MNYETLGKNIRRIRHARGMTIEQVSVITKIGESHIAKVERGVAVPSFETLMAMANVYGVGIDAFAGIELQNNDAVLTAAINALVVDLTPKQKNEFLKLAISMLEYVKTIDPE